MRCLIKTRTGGTATVTGPNDRSRYRTDPDGQQQHDRRRGYYTDIVADAGPGHVTVMRTVDESLGTRSRRGWGHTAPDLDNGEMPPNQPTANVLFTRPRSVDYGSADGCDQTNWVCYKANNSNFSKAAQKGGHA